MINARGNILWIDDEIEHLKPHILFLEEKGYKITQARNGYDALELSMVNAYDLILLDQSMPGMDGIETLTKIKDQNKSHVVIMITKTEVTNLIIKKLPNAQVFVENIKGNDHLQVTVIASEFNGLSLVKQHKLVYSALKEELASEAIHALALKTGTTN